MPPTKPIRTPLVLFATAAFALVVACSSSNNNAPDAGPTPCAAPSDCAAGQTCAYNVTDGCSATLVCLSTNQPLAYSACGCNGQPVSYVGAEAVTAPVSGGDPCDAGTSPTDASSPDAPTTTDAIAPTDDAAIDASDATAADAGASDAVATDAPVNDASDQ